MKIKEVALCALVTVALSACASEPEMKKADNAQVLDAKGLQAVFKRGGGSCKWTAGDVSGEDYYYSTTSKAGGEADRNIGSNTLQGTWSLKGNQLCVNFGKEECSTLEVAGKKKYKATFSGKAYDLGC